MTTIGIDPSRVSSVPEFKVGSRVMREDSQGTKEYVYVKAASAITGAGYVCVIDPNGYAAAEVSTTNSAPGQLAGNQVGVAQAAMSQNHYGWLQVYGASSFRVAANCAKGTILNTTGTAGQLDDDASAGAEVVDGIVLAQANGGQAGNAPGFLNFPKLGRTL